MGVHQLVEIEDGASLLKRGKGISNPQLAFGDCSITLGNGLRY